MIQMGSALHYHSPERLDYVALNHHTIFQKIILVSSVLMIFGRSIRLKFGKYYCFRTQTFPASSLESVNNEASKASCKVSVQLLTFYAMLTASI